MRTRRLLRTNELGSQHCQRGVEPGQQHPILSKLAVTSFDEIRDVAFASEPERGCDRTERDETLMPPKPCGQAAQDPATRRSNRFRGFSCGLRYGLDHRMHLRPPHRALRFRMIRRARLRFHLLTHRFDPFLCSKVELIRELVPQAILAAYLRQNELPIRRLRRLFFAAEQGKDRVKVEPLRRSLQSSGRSVAGPPIAPWPRDHI